MTVLEVQMLVQIGRIVGWSGLGIQSCPYNLMAFPRVLSSSFWSFMTMFASQVGSRLIIGLADDFHKAEMLVQNSWLRIEWLTSMAVLRFLRAVPMRQGAKLSDA